MRGTSRVIARSAVGGLVLLCVSAAIARAQGAPQVQAVTHLASLAPGAIHGTVLDEKGAPVVGAMVSVEVTVGVTEVSMTRSRARPRTRGLRRRDVEHCAHFGGSMAIASTSKRRSSRASLPTCTVVEAGGFSLFTYLSRTSR